MCPPTVPNSVCASKPWPYPRWIAHRGAGQLAPENTWAAFERGAQAGYRMFECDVRQSADGVWFLMHDDTLERTTNGQGLAHLQPWSALCALDAGAWHSAEHTGQTLPTLHDLLTLAKPRAWMLNLELKPPVNPEMAWQWGHDLGQWLCQHQDSAQHLVTSFSSDALAGLATTAPHMQRGHLFEAWSESTLKQTLALGCNTVVLAHRAWEPEHLQRVRAAGLWAVAYTVNEPGDAQRLWAMGLDALITDRVDCFSPDR